MRQLLQPSHHIRALKKDSGKKWKTTGVYCDRYVSIEDDNNAKERLNQKKEIAADTSWLQ